MKERVEGSWRRRRRVLVERQVVRAHSLRTAIEGCRLPNLRVHWLRKRGNRCVESEEVIWLIAPELVR